MIVVNRRFAITSLLIIIMVFVVSFFSIFKDSIDKHSELNTIPRPKNERRKEQNETLRGEHIGIEIHQNFTTKIIHFLRESSEKSSIKNIFYSSSRNIAKFCSSTGNIFWRTIKFIGYDEENRVNLSILRFRDAKRVIRFLNSLILCSISLANGRDLHQTSNFRLLNILDHIFVHGGLGIKQTKGKKKAIIQFMQRSYFNYIQGSRNKCLKLGIRKGFLKILHKSYKENNIKSFRKIFDTIRRMENEIICSDFQTLDKVFHLIVSMQFLFDSYSSKTEDFLHKFEPTPSPPKIDIQIFTISVDPKLSPDSTQIFLYLGTNDTLSHWYAEPEATHLHQKTAFLQFAPPKFLSVMLRQLRSPKSSKRTSPKLSFTTESHPNPYKRSASLSSSKYLRQKKNDTTVSQDFITKTSPLKVDVTEPVDNQSTSTKSSSEINYSPTENMTPSPKPRHGTTKKVKQTRRTSKTYAQRDNQTENSIQDHVLSTRAYSHPKNLTSKLTSEGPGTLDSSPTGKHPSSSTSMESNPISSTHKATTTEVTDLTTRATSIENNFMSQNHKNTPSTFENVDFTTKIMNSDIISTISVHRGFQNSNDIVESTMRTISTENILVSTNHRSILNTSEVVDSNMKTVSTENVPTNSNHSGTTNIPETESTMKAFDSSHKMREHLSKTETSTDSSHRSSEKTKSLRNSQQISPSTDQSQNPSRTTDIPIKTSIDSESTENDHDASEHEKTTKAIKPFNLETEEKTSTRITTEESEPPHVLETTPQQETSSTSSTDDHLNEKQDDSSGAHKMVSVTSHSDIRSDSHSDSHQDSHHEPTQMPVSSYHHSYSLPEKFSLLSSPRSLLISVSQFPSHFPSPSSSPLFETPLHFSSPSSLHFSLQSSSYPTISRTTIPQFSQPLSALTPLPPTSPILAPAIFTVSYSSSPPHSLSPPSTSPSSLFYPPSPQSHFLSSSITPISSLSSTQSSSSLPSILFHHPPEQPSFNTSIEENPWLVAIRGVVFMGDIPLSQNVVFLCEGSIIDPHWVLTAASCFKSPIKDTSYRNITISVGSSDWKGPHVLSVSKTIHHDDYYHKSDSDTDQFQVFGEHNIGLLYTEGSLVAENENVREIEWVMDSSHELPNYLFLAGWADTSNVSLDEGIVPVSRTLREIRIHPISADKCTETVMKMNEMSKDKYIPVNDKSSIHEICSLDELDNGLFTAFAGAPLVDKTDLKHPKQVGIASYKLVFANNHPEGPKIYTQVSHFGDWIKRTIAANS